jgi:formylmethanofuran:tetrahydromethanopterin formyltransferase
MSTTTGSSTADFGATPGTDYIQIVVTGQTGIVAATSKVDAWKSIKATTNHTLEDVVISHFEVFAGNIVDGVGFTIYVISRQGRLTGQYIIDWVWSTT